MIGVSIVVSEAVKDMAVLLMLYLDVIEMEEVLPKNGCNENM